MHWWIVRELGRIKQQEIEEEVQRNHLRKLAQKEKSSYRNRYYRVRKKSGNGL
jgi:hypothetical protein